MSRIVLTHKRGSHSMSPMNPWWDISALLHQTSLFSNLKRKYMWSSEEMLFSMELLAFLGFLEVIAASVARAPLSEVSEIQSTFLKQSRRQTSEVGWGVRLVQLTEYSKTRPLIIIGNIYFYTPSSQALASRAWWHLQGLSPVASEPGLNSACR